MCIRLVAILLIAGAGCTSSSTRPELPTVLFPPPPDDPRLQLLGSYANSLDVEETSSFERTMAGGEQIRLAVERAHGVGWFDGRIYVCDAGSSALAVFDLKLKEMRLVEPDRRGLFKKPHDIAISSDGWKYVTDTIQRKVLVFDAEDRYQGSFGDPEKWRPVGIATAGKLLHVTDTANHCLVVLDRTTGAELHRFGSLGGDKGMFYYPISVAVGPNGDLYVADSFNFRVQRLAPDGSFVQQYGSLGRQLGNFARPKGIAVDGESRVYALDGAFENCQIFDEEGKLLLFFGAPGNGPGAVNMPSNLCIDYAAADAFRDRVIPGYDLEYVIFLTCQAGPHRVNVYGLLRKRP